MNIDTMLRDKIDEAISKKVYAIAKELQAELENEEIVEHIRLNAIITVRKVNDRNYQIVADTSHMFPYAKKLFETYWQNAQKKRG